MELMWVPGVCVGGSFLAMYRVLVRTGHKAGLLRVIALFGLVFFLPFLFSAVIVVSGISLGDSLDTLSVAGFVMQLPGAVVAMLVSLWIAFKCWPEAAR